MARLAINYGVNRRVREPHRRAHVEHVNGKLVVVGAWEDDALHARIARRIRAKHPGWNLTGYCTAKPLSK